MKTTTAVIPPVVAMLFAIPRATAIGVSRGILRHQRAPPQVTPEHYPSFPNVYVVDPKRACTGYMLVGCMQYSPAADHGFGPKFWYHEVVPREDQQLMTRDVCWNFCRNVTGAAAFGLQAGRKCFCTTSYEFYATSGGLGDCNWHCEGDAGQMCGGDWNVSLYEMHDCTNMPPAHCTRAPPQVDHAEIFGSRAYYGAKIPCKNLVKQVANTLEHARCEIECKPGYYESANSLACTEFGNRLVYTWGQFQGQAVCSPKNCGQPAAIEGAGNTHDGVDVYFPGVVSYSCEFGRTTTGKAFGPTTFEVHCTTAGTFSTYEACKRIECEKAGAKSKKNTIMKSPAQGDPVYYGDKVAFQCDNGYTTDGSASGMQSYTETCGASGAQSSSNNCEPVRCGVAPTFGRATLLDSTGVNETITYPTRLNYECNSGYTIDGQPNTERRFSVACQTTGDFSVAKDPCQRVTCGTPKEDLNAGYDKKAGLFEDEVIYTCKEGYTLDKQARGLTSYTLSCRPDGDWLLSDGGSWIAAPSCEPVDCGVPQSHTNAGIHTSCPRPRGACWFRDQPQYKCDAGYSTTPLEKNPAEPMGALYSTMCKADGTFERAKPCQKIDVCESGGQKTCAHKGTCRVHDVVTGKPLDDYSCDCDTGYEQVIVNGEKTCRNINDCPPRGSYAYDCGGSPAGSCEDRDDETYVCNCNLGFDRVALKSPSTNFTCAPMDCGPLPTMDYSVYRLPPYADLDRLIANTNTASKSDHMVYLRPKVEVTCEDGFHLLSGNRSFDMYCKLIGRQVFMTEPEDCVAKSCGKPDAIYLARITGGPSTAEELVYSQTYAERTVNYTCFDGYTTDRRGAYLADPSFTVECLTSGEKSEAEACVPVDCGVVPPLSNARAPKDAVVFPNTVDYDCVLGHSTDGSYDPAKLKSPITCQANGTFTRATPCEPMNCGRAPIIDNAVEQEGLKGDILYPKELDYIADAGWTVDGKATGQKDFKIKCTEHSNFSKYDHWLPLKRVECGSPPHVDYAHYIDKVYVFEDRVLYTCHTGHSIDAKPATAAPATNDHFTIQCLASGRFEAAEECKKVVCPNPPRPANATATTPNPTTSKEFGEEINFECNPGYTLDGSLQGRTDFKTTCKSDGFFTLLTESCTNADNCEGNRCNDNAEGEGTCVDHERPTGNHIRDYSCDCPPGFEQKTETGKDGAAYHFCHNIDDCTTKSGTECLPGTCIDGVQSYACRCPVGYFEATDPKKSCEKQACGEPPAVNNASRADGALQYGDKVEYTCDEGHTLDGEVVPGDNTFEIECMAGAPGESTGTYTRPGECRPVGCRDPVSHDKATHSPQSGLVYPETVTYTCDTGYSIDRACTGSYSYTMQCDTLGRISHVGRTSPSCQSVYVGDPDDAMLPNANFATGAMHYPDVRTITCRTGYSTDEQDYTKKTFVLTTQPNCTFAPYDTCVILKCAAAPAVDNAAISPGGQTEYNQEVTYTLDDGYTTTGKVDGDTSFKLKCQDDGGLDIENIQPVLPVECGEPPVVDHATRPGTALHYGQSVTYACRGGFSLDGNPDGAGGTDNIQKVVDCNSDGQYSELPVCEPVKCPPPPAEAEATADTSKGTVFRDVVTYTCGAGWSTDGVLNGPQTFTRRCTAAGTYDAATGECKNMDDCAGNKCGRGTCQDKAAPTGVHIDDYQCDCESGFDPKIETVDGKQYHVCGNIPDCPAGACEPGSCKDLVNDYECVCIDGYHPVTDAQGHHCQPQSCGAPPAGVQSTRPDDHKVFGQSVTYTCNAGHSLDGFSTLPGPADTFTVACAKGAKDSPDGVYDPTTPQDCLAVSCGVANSHANATSSATGDMADMKYQDFVTWTCEDGYTLNAQCAGAAQFTETCAAAGNFDVAPEPTPVCQAVLVGTPTDAMLPNANYRAIAMYYGDSQIVTCKPGYVAQGGATSFTLQTKTDCSFDSHPTCEPRNCGNPPSVVNAGWTPSSGPIVYPNTVTYTADAWYSVNGEPDGQKVFTISCQDDGNFESLAPFTPLNKIQCPTPDIRMGLADLVTADDLKAEYRCEAGTSLDGLVQGATNTNFEVTCQEHNAQWTTPTGTCEKIKCPNVPAPTYASITSKAGDYVYQEDAEFVCHAGYTLTGDLGGLTSLSFDCNADGTFHALQAQTDCTNADDCAFNQCAPGGTCEDLPNPSGNHLQDYQCNCQAGYQPKTFENVYHFCENIDDCTPNPCSPGTCTDGVNTYTCTCGVGYYVVNPGAANQACEQQQCGRAPIDPLAVSVSYSASVQRDQILRTYDEATYTCEEGATIDGTGSGVKTYTVMCLPTFGIPAPADGTLLGQESCQRVSCGTATAQNNATYTLTQKEATPDLLYGDKVHYTCDQGYTTSGICDGANTFDMACTYKGLQYTVVPEFCRAVAAAAVTPLNVPSANFDWVPMFYGDTKLVTCLPGYETAQGTTSFTITAQSDCTLDIPEVCSPITCAPEPVDPNAVKSGSPVFDAAGLTYTCNTGHTTTGVKGFDPFYHVTCREDGSFSSPESCQPVSCGNPPTVTNGATGATADLKHGDEAVYNCDPGYTGAGTTFTIRCDNGDIQNLQQCSPVSCPVVDDRPKSEPVMPGSVDYPNTAKFICDAGMSTDGNPPARDALPTNLDYTENCQTSGQLTETKACLDIDYCVGHTHCSPGGTCVNDAARHYGVGYACNCNAGYKEETAMIDGHLEVTCTEIDECTESGGDMSCSPNGVCVDGMAKFTCTCGECYTATPTHDSLGETCEVKVCPALPTVENSGNTGGSPPITCSTVILYYCNPGYSTTGTFGDVALFTVECTKDSTYSGVQSCLPVTCPVPTAVQNEESHSPAGGQLKFTEVVTHTCQTGHTITGTGAGQTSFTVVCTETGTYSQAEKCIIVDCGPPDLRSFADVSYSGTTYGDTATYSCDSGYTTDHVAGGPTSYQATCQADGTWAVSDSCQPVQCCVPPDFAFASHTPQTARVFPQQVTVICDNGYTVTGQRSDPNEFKIECTGGGTYGYRWPSGLADPTTWQQWVLGSDDPNCHPLECCSGPASFLAAPANTSLLMTHLHNEAGLHAGRAELARGCKPTSCGTPVDTMYATALTTTDVTVGGEATWECNTGYSVDGHKGGPTNFTKVCQASGAWIGTTDCQDINYCADSPCTANGACFDCSTDPGECTALAAAQAASFRQAFLQVSGGPTGVQTAPDGTPLYACQCFEGYETTTASGDLACTQDDCHGNNCGGGGTCIDLSSQPGANEGDFTCQCRQGFTLVSNAGPPATATCVQSQCEPAPPTVADATFVHYSGGGLVFNQPVILNDMIIYTCGTGFSLDGNWYGQKVFAAYCDSSLDMAPQLQSCRRTKCDSSALSGIGTGATIRGTMQLEYLYEDPVIFDCDPGYTESGAAFTVYCQEFGTFSSGQCDKVVCGAVPQVGNAAVVFHTALGPNLEYQDTVMYQCHSGYELKPAVVPPLTYFTAECMADKSLSPMHSSCEKIECASTPPTYPLASTQHVGPIYAGESIWYDCDTNATTTGTTSGARRFTLTCDLYGNLGPVETCQSTLYNIAGRVTDTSGQPLSNAIVNVFLKSEAHACEFKLWGTSCGTGVTQTTNGIGVDPYADHDDAYHYVEVNNPGCMIIVYQDTQYKGLYEVLVARQQDECIQFSSTMAGTISSFATDFEGVAVAADQSGYYSKEVHWGHYRVRGSASGHTNATHEFSVPQVLSHDFLLQSALVP